MYKIKIEDESNFGGILKYLEDYCSARKTGYYSNKRHLTHDVFVVKMKDGFFYKEGSLELKLSESLNLLFKLNATFIDRKGEYLRIEHEYVIPIASNDSYISII